MNNTVKLEKWKVAQRRHHLSDTQVEMARQLGFNPDKLGKLDNHKQELWKIPLPQHIENLYFKRFGKESPGTIKSIDQQLKENKIKKEKQKQKQKKEKERKRKAKLQEDSPLIENSEIAEHSVDIDAGKKINYKDIKPRTRVILTSEDTPETILQKEAHIFDEAFDFFGEDSVTFSQLGFVLKKMYPQYKPRRYGCKTLGAIYEKLDKYEVIQTGQKGIYNVVRKKEKS